MWQSKRICQVVKSMMAAEMLASFRLIKLFIEICSTAEKPVVLPLDCYIESKQLHEALYSIHPVLNKRLRVEIGIICEMLEKEEIN